MEHQSEEPPAGDALEDPVEQVLRQAWQRATGIAVAAAVAILVVHGVLAVAAESPAALRAAFAATSIGLLALVSMGLFSLQPILLPGRTAGEPRMGLVDRVHRLQERVRELEQATPEVEAFASSVSHDLKQPLNLISSYVQLFEEKHGDEVDDDGREYLHRASEAADRMVDLVDGLLMYTRAGTGAPEFERVDLDAALDDALDNLRLQIEETGATIQRDPLPDVRGTRSQLAQVFQNLVANALKFHREGVPPVVEIRLTRESGTWRVEVEDNGTGFDPAETENLFEIFQRGSGVADREGSGVGLAVCRRIVEAHGGEIEADSMPGDGSVFTVHLPVLEEEAPTPIQERSRELV